MIFISAVLILPPSSPQAPPNAFLRSRFCRFERTTRSRRADLLLVNLQRWWDLKSLNVISVSSLPDLNRTRLRCDLDHWIRNQHLRFVMLPLVVVFMKSSIVCGIWFRRLNLDCFHLNFAKIWWFFLGFLKLSMLLLTICSLFSTAAQSRYQGMLWGTLSWPFFSVEFFIIMLWRWFDFVMFCIRENLLNDQRESNLWICILQSHGM